MDFEKFSQKVNTILVTIVLFVFPLLSLNVFSDKFSTVKLGVLIVSSLFVILLGLLKFIYQKGVKIEIKAVNIFLPLLGLTLILSSLLVLPNKSEAFFSPGATSFYVLSLIFYFVLCGLPNNSKNILSNAIVFPALVLAGTTILSFFKVFESMPSLSKILVEGNIPLLGTSLATAVFLISVLPFTIGHFIKEKEIIIKIFYMLVAFIMVMAATVSGYNIYQQRDTQYKLPPLSVSWSIAIDSLKDSPFLGVGPGNYSSAFNRFLPVSYNNTDLWGVRYSYGGSFILTLLSEVGLIGFIFFAITVGLAIKQFIEKGPNSGIFSFLILTFLMFFVPLSPIFWFFWLIFLGLGINTGKEKEIKVGIVLYILGGLVLAITCIYIWYIKSFFVAEVKYTKAISEIEKGNTKVGYELITEAINSSPKVDKYRLSFARLNLALAQSRLKLNEGKTLSDDDKKAVAVLLEYAIKEGKTAVALNPQRSDNWEILGGIYESVIGIAQGAGDFAVSAYSQAISFDPINPSLRLKLGQLLYSLGRLDDAIKVFEMGILAKYDLPNLHFNLALALKEKGQVDSAIKEMEITLGLVKKDSSDYALVVKELESLKINRKTNPQATENLTPPKIDTIDSNTNIEIPSN